MVTTSEVRVTTASGYPVPTVKPERVISTEYAGTFICATCGAVSPVVEDIDIGDQPGVRRCSCGNAKFYANQVCYHDVVVNSENIFDRNIEISEAENPYGTYCCTNCGAEYEDLKELEKLALVQEGIGS